MKIKNDIKRQVVVLANPIIDSWWSDCVCRLTRLSIKDLVLYTC